MTGESPVELKLASMLAKLVKERRLSLREVARATSVSHTTLNEWCSGRKPRDPLQVRQVARFFKISMHALLFGVEDPHHFISSEKLHTHEPIHSLNGIFEVSIKKLK